MSSNIDRSLDEIIKDQRKAKRKAVKANIQKANQKQGRGAAATQRKPITQKKQGGRRQLTGQRNQGVKQRQMRGQRQQAIKTNTQKNNKQGFVNRAQGKGAGRARVNANPLSQKKSKQIVSKAKRVQANRKPQRQQKRQTEQRDARQNIIDARRGLQAGATYGNRGRGSRQGRGRINNNRINRNQQLQNQQVSDQSRRGRRRWRGGRAAMDLTPQEMRVSVPNNLQEPSSRRLSQPSEDLEFEERFDYNLGKTSTSLNARFSSSRRGKARQTSSGRTIYLE